MVKSPGDILREAVSSLQAGEAGTALSLMIQLKGDAAAHPTARLVRGLAEIASEDWQAAFQTFSQAVLDHPDHGPFFFNLGLVLERLGKKADAIKSYESAFALGSSSVECLGNLSNLYRETNRFHDAEKVARRALVLLSASKPEDALSLHAQKQVEANLLSSLSLALARQARFVEAEESLALALNFFPNHPVYLANKANLKVDQLLFDEAWPCFARVRAVDFSACYRRDEGMARLLAGDLKTGWGLYQARLEISSAFTPPSSGMMVPDFLVGEKDLRGKTICLCFEQGFGDTIQFCRFGAILAERGAQLIWKLQKPLVPLLRDCLPGVVVVEGDVLPPFDYYLPIMSLPWVAQVFAPLDGRPYLSLRSEQKNPEIEDFFAKERINEPRKKRIGVVWAGSPTHARDADRSILLAQLAPLWNAFPDAAFYAPFHGRFTDILAQTKAPIIDLSPFIHDFVDVATCLMHMDLLVTVDTAGTHLAGALGIPTLLMVSFCPDWRWGLAQGKTVWYDSVYLVRQDKAGEWAPVVRRVVAQASSLLKSDMLA